MFFYYALDCSFIFNEKYLVYEFKLDSLAKCMGGFVVSYGFLQLSIFVFEKKKKYLCCKEVKNSKVVG